MIYKEMDEPTLLEACGDDAAKWAAAFCEIAREKEGYEIDEGWMITWFANAIERAWQKRSQDKSKVNTFEIDQLCQKFFSAIGELVAAQYSDEERFTARRICELRGENPDDMLAWPTPMTADGRHDAPRWDHFTPLWVLRLIDARAAIEAIKERTSDSALGVPRGTKDGL